MDNFCLRVDNIFLSVIICSVSLLRALYFNFDLGLNILINFLQCWTPPLLSRSHLKIKKIKIKYNLIFYDEVFVRMLLKMHYPW